MSGSVKLSAADRINALLDSGSFVETGALVTKRSTDFNLHQKEAASDGVITGYGSINSKPVYIYSQDPAVLNGTIGEMHARKIKSLYDLAVKTGTPVIGILDCKGLRLEEATDALNGLGEIFTSQIKASGIIPQISLVLGTCAGAGVVSSSLTDFTIFSSEGGRMFVNSPDAIKGNNKSKCDTSARDAVKDTPKADFVCESDEEAFKTCRKLIDLLPSNNEEFDNEADCGDDLNRLCPELSSEVKDPAVVFTSIADDNDYLEVGKDHSPEMATGFIRLDGITVGCIGNRIETYDEEGNKVCDFEPVLTSKGMKKAKDFVNICDSFNIPLLVINSACGYKASKHEESTIAKTAASLTSAFVNADVAKVTLITGKALGSAYVIMNSKHIGADLVFAWDDSTIGAMDAENAAKIVYAKEIAESSNPAACINEKAAIYGEVLSSAQSAGKRGYVDSVIEPEESRKHLVYAFEMLYGKAMNAGKKHGKY